MGQQKTVAAEKKQVQGPQGSWQQQPEPHQWLRLQSAMKTATRCMRQSMGVPETLVKRKLVEELDFQGQVDRNLKPHHFYIVKKCDLMMSFKTGEA